MKHLFNNIFDFKYIKLLDSDKNIIFSPNVNNEIFESVTTILTYYRNKKACIKVNYKYGYYKHYELIDVIKLNNMFIVDESGFSLYCNNLYKKKD